jgi:hypothetical protein
VRKAAAKIGVHRMAAFRWRHKFLSPPEVLQATLLAGIAEADETAILESKKSPRKVLGRNPRKRGGNAGKRCLSEEQIPVLICRDGEGNTAGFVLEKADKKHIVATLKPFVAPDVIHCTDSGKALCAASKGIGVAHSAVNLAAGPRVVAGVYLVQNFCLRQSPQGVDASLSRRRYEVPAQLSGLASTHGAPRRCALRVQLYAGRTWVIRLYTLMRI